MRNASRGSESTLTPSGKVMNQASKSLSFPSFPGISCALHENPEGVGAAIERVRSESSRWSGDRSSPPRVSLMKHQSEAIASWEGRWVSWGPFSMPRVRARQSPPLKPLGAGFATASQRWFWSPAIYWSNNGWGRSAPTSVIWIQTFLLWVEVSEWRVGRRDVSDFTRSAEYLGPRIVVSTMQSAATPRFVDRVVPGEHLLVVADEVHRIGSPRHRKIMTIDAGGRLALSATPQRYGDPEGTAAIFAYFGEVIEPVFGIPEAIRAGRLVRYDYHVLDVELSDEEQERWDTLTSEVNRVYARLGEVDGVKLPSNQYRMLLIQRARVLKQAAGKVDLARRTLTQHYKDGQRWLVYCDDRNQLAAVRSTLLRESIPTYEYWSGTESALPETLDFIARNGGVLVAIRCLDEGVDVPALDHALILASSSNPREFIQRRGRVLRRAPGKHRAEIYDAMVVPCTIPGATDRMPIVRTELRRAGEFARYAQNRASHFRLQSIASELGLGTVADLAIDFEEGR